MKHSLIYASQFKTQFKHVRKDPRWQPIFHGTVPFDEQKRSPWDYVIDCFMQRQPLPDYFYAHPLHVSKTLAKQIKQHLSLKHISIQILELHFDGHNGNHLLVYYDDDSLTYLVAIGTHSSLF